MGFPYLESIVCIPLIIMDQKSIPHITVVTTYFYPKIGGVENYAYLLAKNLHSSGKYRVSVITSNYDGRHHKKEMIDGMVIYRLPFWFKISNTLINPIWYWQIKRIFSIEQPDIIHLHSPVVYMADVAAIAAKNTPTVLTYHSGSMIKGTWLADSIIEIYETIFLPALFKRANAIVAISQKFAERKFPQFINKIYFIPTGVDLNRFKKTPLPIKETVTFVGRIEHNSSWKGIDQLLEAMILVIKKRPQAKLELIGGGDAVEYYRTRTQKLGISSSVTFFGPQLGQNLVEAYQRAKVVVLPSTSDSEAFSVTLIEAMASGRPIIGTNIGGTPQVIEDGKNGLLVQPKDPRVLAEAIERVFSDHTLATHLADFGAEKARDFSWDIQTKKYSDIFKQLA